MIVIRLNVQKFLIALFSKEQIEVDSYGGKGTTVITVTIEHLMSFHQRKIGCKLSMMKFFFLLFLLPFMVLHSHAQDAFPQAWIGEYEGRMTIGYADRPNSFANVKYTLREIMKDSVWSHTMAFDSEAYGEVAKDYVIRASQKGDSINFILDELNGIEMEMTFMNGCLYGLFMLNEQSYSTTFRKLGNDTLLWDLYVTPHETKQVDVIESGDEENQIFRVSSFKPSLHQTVVFKKAN